MCHVGVNLGIKCSFTFILCNIERSESYVLDVEGPCLLALDCTDVDFPCIEYRDNTSSTSRWLGVPEEHGQYTKVYLEIVPV